MTATQQFHGRRWGTGPCVQQGDAQLPTREGLVDNGDVADHQGQKDEAEGHLAHHQEASQARYRGDIPQTERKKCGAAQIEIGEEADRVVKSIEGKRQSPQQQCKAENEEHRPEQQQAEQGKWSHIPQKGITSAARAEKVRKEDPPESGCTIEDQGQANAPCDPARQDNRLKGVQGHQHNQRNAENDRE